LVDTSVCRKNNDYLYPDATFKFGRDDGGGTTNNKNVLGVYGAPYYYKVVPTEYCLESELRNCVTSSTPTGLYVFPAMARWCSNTSLTTCQAIKAGAYVYPRYRGASATAVAATGSITLNARTAVQGTSGRNVSSIKVGAVQILGATISGAAGMSSNTLAANIATQINTYSSTPEYTAVAAGNVITITSTAAAGATGNGAVSYTHAGTAVSGKTDSAGGVTGFSAVAYTFVRTDIVPATTSYPKTAGRTDCSGATCSYTDEITNFSNWYAYYRTRMQSMKSAVSNAFKPIGSNYRVGFINICKGDYLPVDGFANSVIAVPGVAAQGSFRVGSGSPNTISSITVNGIEILGASVTGTSRTNTATLVAAQINAYASEPEFTATVFSQSGSASYVRITSTTGAGASANGTIAVSGSAGAGSFNHVAGGVDAKGQKMVWYEKLFAQTAAGCGTPLRQALGTAGRIFAGKELSVAGSTSGSTIDPVQYSCQQNFTLLTTDGYWNGSGGLDLDGNAMVNQDGGTTVRPMFEGPTASDNSLADVAKYYYDTDLRSSSLSNCTGSLGAGVDVCENNVFTSSTDNNIKQHMTTFTLGLGVDGTIAYVSDYKSSTSGDYYNLVNGLGSPTVNWPVAVSDSETAVDDLWHAAVNGQGTYFSAKDPAQLAAGLNAALAAIGSKVGAASAAATSTLNPVAGNNNAYVASYSTVKWHGNLEARSINVATGAVTESATWCVENIASGACAPPSAVVASTSGSSTVYNCVTPSATLASCPAPGILDATNNCNVQMPIACTGTMPSKISSASDTRTIYKSNGAGGLEDFLYANLNSSHFNATGLSQWSVLTSSQKTAAAGENLVNFLRGQTGFEERTSNPVDNRLYRFREATLGDALESQPSYIAKPEFKYADPGYTSFKTAQTGRSGTVYMGTNDGMLHAFEGDTGIERWAYVPTAVIPNMWKLADKNYATLHTNYVNGSPVISDICTANCSCDDTCVAGGGAAPIWKTILVGGLNGGGRSYYALDITNPASPSLLWEVSSTTTGFSNLGYSYGQPVITKKSDGTWVALITSGYNNVSPGDGLGRLFVLNANTGAIVSQIATSAGDTTTPSGLSKIAGWRDYFETNNTVGFVYGGDLLGNLWRFDINTGTVLNFATLKDNGGNAQPITTAPNLGLIKGVRMVFVGTGKYLEIPDLTNTATQSIYGIQDADVTTTLTNPRASMTAQTLTASGATRTVSNNTVDLTGVRGWYVDLPDSGERVNINMSLVQGLLLAPTIVPSNTVCSPGGRGWLNYFNYATGGAIDPAAPLGSSPYGSPIVGASVFYINGQPKIYVRTSDGKGENPTPPGGFKSTNFSAKRILWREWLPNQ
jgi:type IV pilus assembly protein PilY1